MTVDQASSATPQFVPVGDNDARVFALDARTRACRLAAKAGLDCAGEARIGQAAVLADMGFAWDPAWLKAIAGRLPAAGGGLGGLLGGGPDTPRPSGG